MQAYESSGDLETQADQVVPLQSKLEVAINERDAAIAKAEGLTPRPGVRLNHGVTLEGGKHLAAALDAHRYPLCQQAYHTITRNQCCYWKCHLSRRIAYA